MSKADDTVTTENSKQAEEHIDQARREALSRFAKYTAPAMLAVLMSGKEASAFSF
jgi:hypothetical protein